MVSKSKSLELLRSELEESLSKLKQLKEEEKKIAAMRADEEAKIDETNEEIEEIIRSARSKLNLEHLLSAIVAIISAYEGRDYVLAKASYISTVPRTSLNKSGRWETEYVPQLKSDSLIIIGNEYATEDGIYYDRNLETLSERDYIIAHKTSSSIFNKDKIGYNKTYDGDDKTIELTDSVDYLFKDKNEFMIDTNVFGNFAYVIKFIESLINYRLQNGIDNLSKDGIEVLKSKFLEEYLITIESNSQTKK